MPSSWPAGSSAASFPSATAASTGSTRRGTSSTRIIAAATTPRPGCSPSRCSGRSWRAPATSLAYSAGSGLLPGPQLKMTSTEFDHKAFTAALPRRPGVYRMFDAAHELLYVGKARSLKDRVSTYFAASNVNPKVQALVQQIAAIEVTVTNSETEALLLEYNLIKSYKPRFNIVLRDDKSFPYIKLDAQHEFPRLLFYR